MIPRTAARQLLERAKAHPVVAVFGPRQSGKTTLVRACFPLHKYVSLENPALQAAAATDPVTFLDAHPAPVILDEVQRVPALLSEVRVRAAEQKQPRDYVLVGSSNLLQAEGAQWSSAGRTSATNPPLSAGHTWAADAQALSAKRACATGPQALSAKRAWAADAPPLSPAEHIPVIDLLPLSLAEVTDAGMAPATPEEWVFRGGFPKLFDARRSPASDYYGDYIRTYVEKGVCEAAKVANVPVFMRAMQILALEAGAVYSQSGMASAIGVTATTLKAWIAVLESTYLVFRLAPCTSNRIKRLVRKPRLYCTDTGLACRLCGITSPQRLAASGQWAHLFRNAVVAEALKACSFRESWKASFARNGNGVEVDLLLERDGRPWSLCQAKASRAWDAADFRGLERFGDALGVPPERRFVVYAGDRRFDTAHGVVLPWRHIAQLWNVG